MGSQRLWSFWGMGIGPGVIIVAEEIRKIIATGVTNEPKMGILNLIFKKIKIPTKHQAKKKRDWCRLVTGK
jgi:hypothetical protein